MSFNHVFKIRHETRGKLYEILLELLGDDQPEVFKAARGALASILRVDPEKTTTLQVEFTKLLEIPVPKKKGDRAQLSLGKFMREWFRSTHLIHRDENDQSQPSQRSTWPCCFV